MKKPSGIKEKFPGKIPSLKKKIKKPEKSKSPRKPTEMDMYKSELKYRQFAEDMPALICSFLPDSTLTYVNSAYCKLFSKRPEDLVGQKFLDFLPDKAARKDVRRQYMSLTPENPIKTYEHEVVVADGTNQARWHRWTDRAFFSDKDEIIHFQSIGQDITERKQDEKSLLESENRYRFLIDNATDVIWTLDMEMRLKYISPSITTLLGFTVEEAMKRPIEQALTPVSVEKAMRIFTERMALQSKSHSDPTQSSIIELEMVHKDGHTVPVEGHFRFLRDSAGEINGLIAIMRDITDRKRAEKSLRESEENYRTLFENATEIIFVAQDGKVVFHNPKVAAMFGYYGEEVIQKPFIEFIHPDDRDMVVERHIRRMKGQDVPTTYSFRFIQKDGVVRWVDLSAVMIEWKGKPATLNFLTDITDRKKAEEKLQNTLESLRKAIGATIQVMVSAIESRDPYTAGHQKRSSALARDIATEMGLSSEKIDGIRMAGSIHDIGKMSIPSEILSKPTNLSEFEFPLIKEHAQKGYDILKDVESPWPLAEIVYQHHERMDGSGYPRNLKGEEILMEARILAVADVVESMASHRPYRPAKGIKVALEEIEKNSGTLYDEAVVDACLRLFREEGYQLEVT